MPLRLDGGTVAQSESSAKRHMRNPAFYVALFVSRDEKGDGPPMSLSEPSPNAIGVTEQFLTRISYARQERVSTGSREDL